MEVRISKTVMLPDDCRIVVTYAQENCQVMTDGYEESTMLRSFVEAELPAVRWEWTYLRDIIDRAYDLAKAIEQRGCSDG